MDFKFNYTTEKNVLEILQVYRPGTDLTHIKKGIIWAAEVKINSWLEDIGIDTPADDIRGMLEYATICMYLENVSKSGEIQNSHGTLKSRQMGKVKTEYDSSSPMFFFANGEARKFYGLLGHETWRMEAFQMVQAYGRAKYRSDNNHISIHGKMKTDKTKRGWNWDQKEHRTDEGQEGWW